MSIESNPRSTCICEQEMDWSRLIDTEIDPDELEEAFFRVESD